MAAIIPEAFEAARLTGYRRYVDLCDPEHPDYNPASLAIVRDIAAHPPFGSGPGAGAGGVAVAVATTPAAFPACPALGPVVESGEGCGCGPKRLCSRFTRIVAAGDCLRCPDRPS